MTPLVSVIALCYNHERFVEEALTSVLTQTYNNIELIIVDDCSTDKSVAAIEALVKLNPNVKFLGLKENAGNCKAFNAGFKLSSGAFVIDFATDDVMLPDRIEKQVKCFASQPAKTGVIFTDAVYVDDNGKALRSHFEYLFRKNLLSSVPMGDVFRNVLTNYFICSPTMMVRREVMDALNGYDETLAYEDFDFWMRASRDFDFQFLDEKTTKVRRSAGSMSSGWYKKGDRQLHSTYLVCLKAEKLCRDEGDLAALRWRAAYEFRQSAFSQNKDEAQLFETLLKRLGEIPASFYWVKLASFLPLPWAAIRRTYYRLRFS